MTNGMYAEIKSKNLTNSWMSKLVPNFECPDRSSVIQRKEV